MNDLLTIATQRAYTWLQSPAIDDQTKDIIQQMLAPDNSKLLIDSFYKDLEFGTGGLRGVMGVGSNCMNRYTIGAATQGLANYLKKSFTGSIKVAIAYDSRNNSAAFAQVTADIFSANGIEAYLVFGTTANSSAIFCYPVFKLSVGCGDNGIAQSERI
jgi:phosphoglucomutase